jgi:hypothetical protein
VNQIDTESSPRSAAVTRVCSFCLSRMPLSSLVPQTDSMVCADRAGCDDRAARSGVYAPRESEDIMMEHAAMQGALR